MCSELFCILAHLFTAALSFQGLVRKLRLRFFTHLKLFLILFSQDFADIIREPTLDKVIDLDAEDDDEEPESQPGESGVLSPACLQTVVQVHQRLCLSHGQALWYQSSAKETNPTKDYVSALVSSYQIAAPVISRFYHLIGMHIVYCIHIILLSLDVIGLVVTVVARHNAIYYTCYTKYISLLQHLFC